MGEERSLTDRIETAAELLGISADALLGLIQANDSVFKGTGLSRSERIQHAARLVDVFPNKLALALHRGDLGPSVSKTQARAELAARLREMKLRR